MHVCTSFIWLPLFFAQFAPRRHDKSSVSLTSSTLATGEVKVEAGDEEEGEDEDEDGAKDQDKGESLAGGEGGAVTHARTIIAITTTSSR